MGADLIRFERDELLVATSDSVLNNPSLQYPCSYGRSFLHCLLFLACATLAQAICDDILPRHLVPAPFPQHFFRRFSFSTCLYFLLHCGQSKKLEDVSVGWFAARYDRGFSNRWY